MGWSNLINRPLRENLEILMPAWNNRTRGDHGITEIKLEPTSFPGLSWVARREKRKNPGRSGPLNSGLWLVICRYAKVAFPAHKVEFWLNTDEIWWKWRTGLFTSPFSTFIVCPFRPSLLFYGTELVVALLYGTEQKLRMYNTSIMFLWYLLLQMCNKYKMKMLQGRCTAEILTKEV